MELFVALDIVAWPGHRLGVLLRWLHRIERHSFFDLNGGRV